jgi:hypothetical protein
VGAKVKAIHAQISVVAGAIILVWASWRCVAVISANGSD